MILLVIYLSNTFRGDGYNNEAIYNRLQFFRERILVSSLVIYTLNSERDHLTSFSGSKLALFEKRIMINHIIKSEHCPT